MSRCRSCNAEVLWVVVVNTGRRMPIDAEPAADGNVLLEGHNKARVLGREAAAELQDGEQLLYRSHFSTCPDKDGWRRHRGQVANRPAMS